MAFLVARCSQALGSFERSTADEPRKAYFQSCLLHCGEAGAPSFSIPALWVWGTRKLQLQNNLFSFFCWQKQIHYVCPHWQTPDGELGGFGHTMTWASSVSGAEKRTGKLLKFLFVFAFKDRNVWPSCKSLWCWERTRKADSGNDMVWHSKDAVLIGLWGSWGREGRNALQQLRLDSVLSDCTMGVFILFIFIISFVILIHFLNIFHITFIDPL